MNNVCKIEHTNLNSNANFVSKLYYMSKSNASKTTGAKAAKSASKVLKDDRTGKDSKAAAGSALSQKVGKKRKN